MAWSPTACLCLVLRLQLSSQAHLVHLRDLSYPCAKPYDVSWHHAMLPHSCMTQQYYMHASSYFKPVHVNAEQPHY